MSDAPPTLPDEPELPVAIGSVVEGKFVIERLIAQGGMGAVMAARHLVLDDRVALKFLRREGEGARARFQREARAAVKLKGPHVARVIDYGETSQAQSYIVMEYLEGEDLGHVLDRGRVPDVRDAATWIVEACDALAEAHAQGIVHRDVKPENLFLARRAGAPPSIKLLDFGISKLAPGAGPTDLTQTRELLGTPLYMSPEQVRWSRTIDARTDVWSLGAVLYELLAGKPPFDAQSVTALCAMIVEDQPTPLEVFRSDVPAALEQAVLRCLAKRADARFQDVSELARALLPFAHPRVAIEVERSVGTLAARTVQPQAAPTERRDNTTLNATGEPTTRDARTQGALALGVGAALLVAGLALGTSQKRTPAAAPPLPTASDRIVVMPLVSHAPTTTPAPSAAPPPSTRAPSAVVPRRAPAPTTRGPAAPEVVAPNPAMDIKVDR